MLGHKKAIVIAAISCAFFATACSDDRSTQSSGNTSSDTPEASSSAVPADSSADAGEASTAAPSMPGTEVMPIKSSPQSYMPIEATYITQGAVNQRATDMLQSKEFEKLLNAFEAQNAGRVNELASAYRVAIEETLAEMAGGRKLDRIACATEMCIATMRSVDTAWYEAWRDSLQEKGKLPMQVVVHHEAPLPGGGTEYRLLFTTGENSEGGIMGGPFKPGG